MGDALGLGTGDAGDCVTTAVGETEVDGIGVVGGAGVAVGIGVVAGAGVALGFGVVGGAGVAVGTGVDGS